MPERPGSRPSPQQSAQGGRSHRRPQASDFWSPDRPSAELGCVPLSPVPAIARRTDFPFRNFALPARSIPAALSVSRRLPRFLLSKLLLVVFNPPPRASSRASQLAVVAPREEPGARARIGAPVWVADVGGEEFHIAQAGGVAGDGDQRRHQMELGVSRGRERGR